jgi:chitodextrinase
MKKILSTFSILSTFFIILTLFQTTYLEVFAADDQFTITQTIIMSLDIIDPTVPLSLTALGVSSSQIDLAWASSTDNNIVSGYRIFRDSVFIATSTNIFYHDTGLSSDTTYSYQVEAFDATSNYSGLSSTATGTTYAIPPSSGGSGSRRNIISSSDSSIENNTNNNSLEVLDFYITPKTDGVYLNLNTNRPVKMLVSFGKTESYELPVVYSLVFESTKTLLIDGLSPGTRYYMVTTIEDGYGEVVILPNQTFLTLDIFTPPTLRNVTNLNAARSGSSIVVSWDNPIDNFDSVRVVRSNVTYPKDIADGEIIYVGTAESFVEESATAESYYYTVFAKSPSGEYASGAITAVDAVAPVVVDTSIPEEIKNITLQDFVFSQAGERIVLTDNVVHVKGDEDIAIYLPTEVIDETEYSVRITLVSGSPKQENSYLLRVDGEKMSLRTLLGALQETDNFDFSLVILDSKGRELRELPGIFASLMPETIKKSKNFIDFVVDWTQNNIKTASAVVAGILLMGILFWLVRFYRK